MKLANLRGFNALGLIAIGIVGGVLVTAGVLVGANSMQSNEKESSYSPPSVSAQNSERIDISVDSVADLAQLQTDLKRTAALHRLVTAADESDLLSMLEHSKNIESERLRRAVEIGAVRKLAESSPQLAVAQLANLAGENHEELVAAIYGSWAESSLEDAVVQASGLDATMKQAALRSIVSARSDLSIDERLAIAKRLGGERYAIDLSNRETANQAIDDPESAWNSFVNDESSDLSQTEHLIEVAEIWISQEGIRVIDRVSESLSTPVVRDAVVTSVLHNITPNDPASAFRQALSLKSSSRELALTTIAEVWSASSPAEALMAVMAVETDSERELLQQTVLQTWAAVDPNALLDAIEQLPEAIRVLATEAAMFAIARISPDQATRFLAEVTDRDVRDQLAKEIAAYWSESDVASALDWALNDEFATDVLQAEVLMIVLADLATKDPDLAFRTARQQPVVLRGQYYRGLEVTVIQHLVETDIDKASSMLSEIRSEGLTIPHAYSEVGRAMVRNGDIDQALKLGERLSGRRQSNYNGSLMYQGALVNPESLLEAIEGLPTDELKLQAVRGLNRFNPQTKALSDEQLEYANSFL